MPALPGGFNPETGTFDNIRPVIQIPRNTSRSSAAQVNSTYATGTSYTHVRRRSLWDRFNDTIEDIGNWFADHAETVLGWVTIIFIAVLLITGVGVVISTWISKGFWTALFTAIGVAIAGALTYFIAIIAIYIVVNIVMYGMRLLFWNGWSLLVTLVLLGGVFTYTSIAAPHSSSKAEETEVVQQVTETYRVTASRLNVRAEPNTNCAVLGKLKRGTEVEVLGTTGNFAEIEYNGQKAYASLEYLKKIETIETVEKTAGN